jgi:hypothetical protein
MHSLVDRTYLFGPVTITRHPVDWPNLDPEFADLAQGTMERLENLPTITDEHRYLNPLFSLYAPAYVEEKTFLRQARRACVIWMRQLKSVAGYNRIRRFQKHSTPAARMQVTSGILILSGKLVHIKRLNDVQPVAQTC